MLRYLKSHSFSSDDDLDDRYQITIGEEEIFSEEGIVMRDLDDGEHEEEHGLAYGRSSLEPDGEMTEFDYSIDPNHRLAAIASSNLYNVLSLDETEAHHQDVLLHDAELGTNEDVDDTFETSSDSGLYSDDGMQVDVEELYSYSRVRQQQQSNSSFMRFLYLAREDLAATFKDPQQFQNQHYRKAQEDSNFMDTSEMPPIETVESESSPITDTTTQVSSIESSEEQVESSPEAIEFDPNPVLFEEFMHVEERNSSRERRSSSSEKKKVHFRLCAHGIIWTTLAFAAGIVGIYTSITSHRSSHFVNLDKPIYVAPIYEPVHSIGLFRMEVCYNQTVTGLVDCTDHELSTTSDIGDNMFEVSRVLASLGLFFGGLATFILMTALCWESINIKPVSLCFFVAYFLQSFAMLFFDSNLCSEFDCRIGSGCALCIGASLCWLVACVAITRMDNFKIRAIRRRKYIERLARRRARQIRRKQRRLLRKMSTLETQKTMSTRSDTTTWAVPSQSSTSNTNSLEEDNSDINVSSRYEC